MDEKQKMIEKVSKLYREKLKETNDIERELREIKEKLKDKTLPYGDYIHLEFRLKILENDYFIFSYTAQGISDAREALFSE